MPIMVVLSGLDGFSMARPSSSQVANVYPGRYTIRTLGGPPGAYVESIRLGDAEVYGRAVDIFDGSMPIRIAYRRGGPVLRGTVEKGEGATVQIVDADESAAEDSRAVTAGRDGSFQVDNLRPGDYYVVAVQGAEAGLVRFLSRRDLMGKAEKVRLEKGATVVVTLKVRAVFE